MIAVVTTNIAWIILVIALGGWIVYGLTNVRRSRAEIGSEITLAANRKPYYDDEILEGKKIERTQLIGLLFLVVVTISLPLYWILEPGREAGAVKMWDHQFDHWGSKLFAATADGGYNCAGCHGGMKGPGGAAAYAITDPKTGEVKEVSWKAPAINTIYYRYSEEEVRFILNYGRPFSPMSPWGLVGGGPMNEQQIQTVLTYLKGIQIPREDCRLISDDPLTCDGGHLPKATQDEIQAEAERLVAAGTYKTVGEALFNLDLGSGNYSRVGRMAIRKSRVEVHSDRTSPEVRLFGSFHKNLTWLPLLMVAVSTESDMASRVRAAVGCQPLGPCSPNLKFRPLSTM